jgi:peptidoglycan/xylan/chitin deacetylase (PgdA/CDA1 family)
MTDENVAKAPCNQCVPIIVYHHVYHDGSPELKVVSQKSQAGIIGAGEFRRQLEYTFNEGWEPVTTSQIIEWLEGKSKLPAKAFAIHFDNGWADTLTVAASIMNEYNLRGTVFPITDGIDAASQGTLPVTVCTSTEGVTTKPFLTWDGVRQLLEGGWEIGAHTASHCKMGDLHSTGGDKSILQEVEKSNNAFRRELGFTPKHFAYPSGSRNVQTDELLLEHYSSLRLWYCEYPTNWKYTNCNTPISAIETQNVDMRVSFCDFKRIFNSLSSS